MLKTEARQVHPRMRNRLEKQRKPSKCLTKAVLSPKPEDVCRSRVYQTPTFELIFQTSEKQEHNRAAFLLLCSEVLFWLFKRTPRFKVPIKDEMIKHYFNALWVVQL